MIRATQDVDLLIDASQAGTAEGILTRLGYHCIYRSGDAGNCQRNAERVDLLYAQRPIARRLLAEAPARQTPFGMLRVVGLEGLIGFNLTGLVKTAPRGSGLEPRPLPMKLSVQELKPELAAKPGTPFALMGGWRTPRPG